MSRRLLQIGGVLNGLGVLFHLLLWKVLAWPTTLLELSDINRGTVYVLNNHVTLAILLFAYISLFHSKELITTRLGKVTVAAISLFYGVRAAEQLIFYNALNGPGLTVVIIASLLALLYLIPLIASMVQPYRTVEQVEALHHIVPLRELLEETSYSEVKTLESHRNLADVIATMLSDWPWWMRLLMHVRQLLVFILGLVRHEKPEQQERLRPEDISFIPGDTAGFFEVVSAEPDHFWFAKTPDDKHLIAFLGVVAEPSNSPGNLAGTTCYHIITLVQYLHWTGPVYFNIIRPFHHFVIDSMLRTVARYEQPIESVTTSPIIESD